MDSLGQVAFWLAFTYPATIAFMIFVEGKRIRVYTTEEQVR